VLGKKGQLNIKLRYRFQNPRYAVLTGHIIINSFNILIKLQCTMFWWCDTRNGSSSINSL